MAKPKSRRTCNRSDFHAESHFLCGLDSGEAIRATSLSCRITSTFKGLRCLGNRFNSLSPNPFPLTPITTKQRHCRRNVRKRMDELLFVGRCSLILYCEVPSRPYLSRMHFQVSF